MQELKFPYNLWETLARQLSLQVQFRGEANGEGLESRRGLHQLHE